MKTKNPVNASGGSFPGTESQLGDGVSKVGKRLASFPAGSIGAHLARRNYVKYLVERYHRYREADVSFGRNDRFHYSVLFKNIETKFKAPTYFIPQSRFAELVDYLHGRINNTMLGRVNSNRGIPNYKSFDEYVLPQVETAVNA